MRKFHAISCLLLIATFLFVATAGAQVTVNTTIPGVPVNPTGGSGICDTIFGFYDFAMALGGVLALGAITYGGVKYTMAAGNPSGQSEGKAWIRDALLGLLLLAGAYLILNIINPDLTKCGLPEALDRVAMSTGAESSSAPTSTLNCVPTTGNMGTCKNCFNSPDLNSLLFGSCLPAALKSSVSATTGGQHACNIVTGRASCHFGGSCNDGGHAVDFSRSGLASAGLTVPQAEAMLRLATCPGVTLIRCELGSAPVACSSADHIHVNVGNSSCNCN